MDISINNILKIEIKGGRLSLIVRNGDDVLVVDLGKAKVRSMTKEERLNGDHRSKDR